MDVTCQLGKWHSLNTHHPHCPGHFKSGQSHPSGPSRWISHPADILGNPPGPSPLFPTYVLLPSIPGSRYLGSYSSCSVWLGSPLGLVDWSSALLPNCQISHCRSSLKKHLLWSGLLKPLPQMGFEYLFGRNKWLLLSLIQQEIKMTNTCSLLSRNLQLTASGKMLTKRQG